MSIAAQLRDKGIELPQPSKAIANYVPIVRSGNHLIVSGQLCFDAKGELYKGKLGAEVTLEQGQFAARCCGLNLLAQVATELPDLESIKRVVLSWIEHSGFMSDAKLVRWQELAR